MLDETRSLGLVGIALGASVLLSGGGAVVLGFLWLTWRTWDAIGFPTMQVFRGLAWIVYWPGLLTLTHDARTNELSIALISLGAWFLVFASILLAGRAIRIRQGKAWQL